jgi:glucuronate isomerase
MPLLDDDRLFPPDPGTRDVARRLFNSVRSLPIVSPNGHTDAKWFAQNEAFPDPATLLIVPDHYIFRMLYSQGIRLEELGIGSPKIEDSRKVWRIFAEHYYLFRGTPTRLWLDYVFQELFAIEERLSAKTADLYYDRIADKLGTPEFRPRALYEQFQIEVLATTDSPCDSLNWHQAIRDSGWKARILPTFRPDSVVNPDLPGFRDSITCMGKLAGEDCLHWNSYLRALAKMRLRFKQLGCTATDHGHPSAQTADLDAAGAAKLYERVIGGKADSAGRELFRAQMLTEMARMSLEDGLVMQIHPGSSRDHNPQLFARFGSNMGADIPTPANYVDGRGPLLQRFGNEPGLSIILFTLDEAAYSRELAPLAGHYPCLILGPPWWFYDSPEGMIRYRQAVTETAGFYNTAGFNDDTRAFLSIPARHDLARRMDCSYLARLVVEHQIHEDEAFELAGELAGGLARRAYRL